MFTHLHVPNLTEKKKNLSAPFWLPSVGWVLTFRKLGHFPKNGGQRGIFKLNPNLKSVIVTIWLAVRYNFENICGWCCAAVRLGSKEAGHGQSRPTPPTRYCRGHDIDGGTAMSLLRRCRFLKGGDWYIVLVTVISQNVDFGSNRGVNVELFAAVWTGTLPP